jgi:hypothetical protein
VQLGVADFVVDRASNPTIGANGAADGYPNTCFGDNVHMQPACIVLDAAATSAAWNHFMSPYTPANPHRIAGAGAYTMSTGDGGLDITSATAATIPTLPPCYGLTGHLFQIRNSQSSYPVTVLSASSTQPIDGVDRSSSGLTIAANTAINLRVKAYSSTTAGCYWTSL